MNTTLSTAKSAGLSTLAAVMLAVMIGAGLIAAGGLVQASALHDAAHDVRHTTGFPCH
ncbi:MAG: CbtB-domain containing protein [Rhodobacteraceae bacterium]|nr:CbtB-domain containing protein [Paracoccaceae bacterium]